MVKIMKLNKSPEILLFALGYMLAGLILLFVVLDQPSSSSAYVEYIISTPTIEINNDQNQLININTAQIETLCTLNGIGEIRAESIIEYRNSNGGFETIEEIMQVKGIGEKTFEAIKDDIMV